MIDQNTTGSEQTTTEETPAATETEQQASTDTSTTETQTQTEETPADDGTLLTGKTGEETTEQSETTDTNEFHGAPEGDYEPPALPEGMTMDEESLAAFTPIAKELGLNQAGFGKVVDLYATQILPKVQDVVVDNLQKDIAAQHATWATESRELVQTDTETFGANAKLEDVLAVSAKAIDRFGGKEFRDFLQTTGLGNHPAMVKMAYQIGTLISEDTSFERGGAAPTAKTSVEKFYGPQS